VQPSESKTYLFPRWANYLLPILIIMILGGAVYVPVFINYGMGAPALKVGYQPMQPVPFSHELHAGKLGMDCRYCHTTVDRAAFAAIPATEVCINCHNPQQDPMVSGIWKELPSLEKVHESYATGEPIEWVKVHQLADYAYFDHAAHVNKGVSCVSCHGRIDRMAVVETVEPLSMSWCLDCHRNPEQHLRPVEEVYNLAWKPEPLEGESLADAQRRIGLELKDKYNIHDRAYMTACSTCHR
jgi:hypothetical protein